MREQSQLRPSPESGEVRVAWLDAPRRVSCDALINQQQDLLERCSCWSVDMTYPIARLTVNNWDCGSFRFFDLINYKEELD